MQPLHAVVMGATALALLAGYCNPIKPESTSRSNSNSDSQPGGGGF